MRAKVHTEEIRKDREALIVTAIPYQVNKRVLIEKIAEQVRDKRIEGISDLWDESNREGMRIVIELKRDAMADVVLNQLWRHSDLQTTFGANMLAINGGRPEQLNLKDFIAIFTAFREEVVSRRTKHLLAKSRERAHVLVGLAVAVANIDEMIRLIRAAPSPAEAREQMMARDWPAKDIGPLVELIADPRHKLTAGNTIRLSDEQARAILELRLQRLTALGRDEIGDELKKLGEEIKEYLAILVLARCASSTSSRRSSTAIKTEFATPRQTEIVEMEGEVEDEDLIQREDVRRHRQPPRLHQARAALHLSRPAPRRQGPRRHVDARGGRGHADLRRLHAHAAAVLLLARHGLPHEGVAPAGRHAAVGRQGAGQPAAAGRGRGHHLDPAAAGGPERPGARCELMFATRSGNVRRNSLADFENINRNGKIAMKLEEGDRIVRVAICMPGLRRTGEAAGRCRSDVAGDATARARCRRGRRRRAAGQASDNVLLTTAPGRCIRFPVDDVRLFKGRDSTGVRGIRLEEGDEVISMAILRHVEATPGERAAYLKQALAVRRAAGRRGRRRRRGARGGGRGRRRQPWS